MDNGIIGWIPEDFSLQLIVLVIIFVVPAFCITVLVHLTPLITYGEFLKVYMEDDPFGAGKSKVSRGILLFINICIVVTMYVVWVRWFWSLFDKDNTWLLDILYGKGN